ncbi:hypothetical protein GEMRC1_002687 [Eukaryota sp. GEM-RC1]
MGTVSSISFFFHLIPIIHVQSTFTINHESLISVIDELPNLVDEILPCSTSSYYDFIGSLISLGSLKVCPPFSLSRDKNNHFSDPLIGPYSEILALKFLPNSYPDLKYFLHLISVLFSYISLKAANSFIAKEIYYCDDVDEVADFESYFANVSDRNLNLAVEYLHEYSIFPSKSTSFVGSSLSPVFIKGSVGWGLARECFNFVDNFPHELEFALSSLANPLILCTTIFLSAFNLAKVSINKTDRSNPSHKDLKFFNGFECTVFNTADQTSEVSLFSSLASSHIDPLLHNQTYEPSDFHHPLILTSGDFSESLYECLLYFIYEQIFTSGAMSLRLLLEFTRFIPPSAVAFVLYTLVESKRISILRYFGAQCGLFSDFDCVPIAVRVESLKCVEELFSEMNVVDADNVLIELIGLKSKNSTVDEFDWWS